MKEYDYYQKCLTEQNKEQKELRPTTSLQASQQTGCLCFSSEHLILYFICLSPFTFSTAWRLNLIEILASSCCIAWLIFDLYRVSGGRFMFKNAIVIKSNKRCGGHHLNQGSCGFVSHNVTVVGKAWRACYSRRFSKVLFQRFVCYRATKILFTL